MTGTRPARVFAYATVLAAFTAALAGCGNDNAGPATTANDFNARPALEEVVSACDEYGNRIYKWSHGVGSAHPAGSIAVVPADPSCRSGG